MMLLQQHTQVEQAFLQHRPSVGLGLPSATYLMPLRETVMGQEASYQQYDRCGIEKEGWDTEHCALQCSMGTLGFCCCIILEMSTWR